jgi:hypothetical protein
VLSALSPFVVLIWVLGKNLALSLSELVREGVDSSPVRTGHNAGGGGWGSSCSCQSGCATSSLWPCRAISTQACRRSM